MGSPEGLRILSWEDRKTGIYPLVLILWPRVTAWSIYSLKFPGVRMQEYQVVCLVSKGIASETP